MESAIWWLTGWMPWRWTCCLGPQVWEELEVPRPPSPRHSRSARPGTPPALYCSLKCRQGCKRRDIKKKHSFSSTQTTVTGNNVSHQYNGSIKKRQVQVWPCDVKHTYTRWYREIPTLIPLYEAQWRSVTAVGREHSATCHRGELQQRLRRHFDGHASLQVGPVTLDGHAAVLRLHGAHSVLCGLQGGLHWDVPTQGLVLVRVPAVALLGPGTVEQRLTLRRIRDVSARNSSSGIGKKT